LANREARVSAPSGTKTLEKSGQNQWAALAAARKMSLKKSPCFVVVYLYNSVRTYFIKNS
jgi:hypothetical protein